MGLSILVRYMYGRVLAGRRSTHVFVGVIEAAAVKFAVLSVANGGLDSTWVESVRKDINKPFVET